MNEFHFNVEAALRYGVDEAIFLHCVAFWVEKNRANKEHLHNGRYWTYNTQAALAELYPFWTPRQIARISASCETQGAIMTDTLNADKSIRTKWYTLTDDAAAFYFDTKTVICSSPNGELDGPQCVGEYKAEKAHTISPNGGTEPCQPSHQTVDCIKGNSYLPDNKPPISPKGDGVRKRPRIAAEWKPERFEAFWTYYSKHACGKDKEGARKAWNKLKPDDALIGTMARAIQAQVSSEEWQRGIGIPHAQTWLNRRRWEDEDEPEQTPEPDNPTKWGWGA